MGRLPSTYSMSELRTLLFLILSRCSFDIIGQVRHHLAQDQREFPMIGIGHRQGSAPFESMRGLLRACRRLRMRL
jgi:hypothetical protein